jgi:hypothetical protein
VTYYFAFADENIATKIRCSFALAVKSQNKQQLEGQNKFLHR